MNIEKMEPEKEQDSNADTITTTATPTTTTTTTRKRPSRPSPWDLISRRRHNLRDELRKHVTDKLTNQDLREILLKSPETRAEFGCLKDPDFIFQFVPREFKNQPISDVMGKMTLQEATENAMYDRLGKFPS